MAYATIVSVDELKLLLAGKRPVRIFDCSFDLSHAQAGRDQYLQSHIPGAVFADLDRDLSARHGVPGAHGVLTASGADEPASGGRHPLPNRAKFAIWLAQVGLTNDMQAVVYDRNGNNFCGRLWWMLKWVGHEHVAVLDGGLRAWADAGGQMHVGEEPTHFQTNFELRDSLVRLVDANDIAKALGKPTQTLVDARAPARFRGEIEPLDPVAGHIPGALNRPFSANLLPNGHFKSAAQLKIEFADLLGTRDLSGVVHHCGSGVSALPNLIAMELAGLGPTSLYAGSWSDWCSDPGRPTAQG